MTLESSESTQLLTAEQLAARWQISTAQVYRLARDGRLPAARLGRYKRFRRSTIEAFETDQEKTS
jgi:excisionase family DNA binding protein